MSKTGDFMNDGQALTPDQRATRSLRQIVGNLNRSIRRDRGGKTNPIQSIRMEMWQVPKLRRIFTKKGLDNDDVETLAEWFWEIHAKKQIEGVRKRTDNDRDELKRRASELEEALEITDSYPNRALIRLNEAIKTFLYGKKIFIRRRSEEQDVSIRLN